MQRVQTSLRIDKQVLYESKDILKSLGLNFTDAVNIFAHMVVKEKGLPFAVKIPNKTTIKSINEAKNNIGITSTYDEFINENKC
jgi:DNA-damage-inducible protein J